MKRLKDFFKKRREVLMNELSILYGKNLVEIPMLKFSKCKQAITGHSN